MAKRKLQRFAEVETFDNVIQMPFTKVQEGVEYKGRWASDFFHNTNPIVLELGCGKGEYTVGLASKYPGKNFIGLDIKGNRLWRGAKTAIEEGLNNVAFIRTRIDFIENCFEENEVSEIWITFPDPQPQEGKAKKRLTSPLFLSRYKKLLIPEGYIHLKTDSFPLYEYTLEVIQEGNHTLVLDTSDLYNEKDENFDLAKAFQTYYEKRFLEEGKTINYIRFQLEKSSL